MNKKLFFCSVILFPVLSYSQIGINTSDPTKELDVNGDLRVVNVPISTNSFDYDLVADADGVMKVKSKEKASIFRGQLSQNFTSPQDVDIPHLIPAINVLTNPNEIFNPTDNIITIKKKGLYSVTFTTTMLLQGATLRNFLVGIVDASNSNWLLPFRIDQNNAPTNALHQSYTFTGVVELDEGQTCYFGSTGYSTHIAFVGNNASSTYFELSMIKEL